MISAKTRSIQRNRVEQERIQNEAAISEAQCSIETRMRRPNSKLKHLDRSRRAFHDHQHGSIYETDLKDVGYNSSKIRAQIETKTIDYYLNKSRRSHQKARINLRVDKRICT